MALKTRKGQLEAAGLVRAAMEKAYQTAVYAYRKQSEVDKTLSLAQIRVLSHIKHRIELKARLMGHSKACREAIGVCKGECCRWHFPKNLTAVDFFISLHYLSPAQQIKLTRLLRPSEDIRYQCPILNSDGCFFHFEARPMVCTAAYPCFARQPYWEYYTKQQQEVFPARQVLENLIYRLVD